MAFNDKIAITDTQSKLWQLPNFIKSYIFNTFIVQGFIYLNDDNKATSLMTEKVQWLDKYQVYTTTEKRCHLRVMEDLKNKYPEHGDYIKIL